MISRNVITEMLVIASLTIAMGCSRTMPQQEDRLIVPRASIGSSAPDAASKVVIENGAALTAFFARADQNTGGVYGAFSTSLVPGVIAAGSGQRPITLTPTQSYIDDVRKTKFIGFYPEPTTTTATSVSWTLDGTQDVMTSVAVEGNMTDKLGAFAFKHKMAQVQLWIYAETQVAVDYWGAISGIQLQGTMSKCTYNYADGATGNVVFSDGDRYFDADLPRPVAIPVSAANAKKFATFLVSGSFSNLFIATAEGDFDVSVEKTLQQGVSYKVVLKMTGSNIEITSIGITDWVEGRAPGDDIVLQ